MQSSLDQQCEVLLVRRHNVRASFANHPVEPPVGAPDEFDRAPGYISMNAPLARALLKKRIDDEVKVELPSGHASYIITGIHYEDP